mmetsp:Transcript_46003/g.118697  ORF Transcript_46003/g.118697 Transcript_46003/m.118697 type:complete len:238 (-) Transcript_46003:692-1405(-)
MSLSFILALFSLVCYSSARECYVGRITSSGRNVQSTTCSSSQNYCEIEASSFGTTYSCTNEPFQSVSSNFISDTCGSDNCNAPRLSCFVGAKYQQNHQKNNFLSMPCAAHQTFCKVDSSSSYSVFSCADVCADVDGGNHGTNTTCCTSNNCNEPKPMTCVVGSTFLNVFSVQPCYGHRSFCKTETTPMGSSYSCSTECKSLSNSDGTVSTTCCASDNCNAPALASRFENQVFDSTAT